MSQASVHILGIETSCDETCAAVVRDGRIVCSNVVASQVELHARFGGVFPELASRQHVRDILPVIRLAMSEASLDWDDIDGVAVTYGPGLSGALLVGVNVAKGLCLARRLPLIPVSHLEGHLYSNWLHEAGEIRTPASLVGRESEVGAAPRASAAPDKVLLPRASAVNDEAPPPNEPSFADEAPSPPASAAHEDAPPPNEPSLAHEAPPPRGESSSPTDPAFPLLALIVSGGHTDLVLVEGHGSYEVLGRTLDDAAGESLDKAARALGLGYPGGPEIERAAAAGDAESYSLPIAETRSPLDFSFSGVKTALLRQVQGCERDGSDLPIADLAAAFQAAVVGALVGRVERALALHGVSAVFLAGGVSANMSLRRNLVARCPVPVVYPPLALCTDNAAMIAAAGYQAYQRRELGAMDLDVTPGLKLGDS